YHFALARLAIEAGLHPLVAKPVTNDFAEAVALADLADARGVTLAVGQQMRYRNHYEAVARFVGEGRLGTPQAITFIHAKPRPRALNRAAMTQPALYEMSCHHFDCLMAIVPEARPEWISCDGFRPSWSPYAGPCMVNAAIRFDGNLHVLYQGGFSSLADSYELRIEGTGGALRCRGVHMSRDGMAYEFAEPLGAWTPLDLEAGLPPSDPWRTLLALWRRHLAGEIDPPFSGRRNLRPFALLSAGVASVETGLPATLGPGTPYAAAFEDRHDRRA
ncbi:MAG: Gfo/Idh/MocA family protein, partial [Chloroflexota bacterium]